MISQLQLERIQQQNRERKIADAMLFVAELIGVGFLMLVVSV